MFQLIKEKRVRIFCKVLSCVLSVFFAWSTISPSMAMAQSVGMLNLPVPGTMVNTSPAFVPVLLKGMTIHPEDPLKFDFIVDGGNTGFETDEVRAESERLVKYFLASMTIPKDDLWVNLSPHESDRIIPNELGKTELGRDLLAQDYILKQLTATMMHPDSELGAKFWDKVREEAKSQYGVDEVPTDTFNKVWILPDQATVYEHEQTVYLVDAKLKVMTDADYVAAQEQSIDPKVNLNSEVIKEIIIPAITKEINEGKNFAPLRQIYHSLILAKWYKETIKTSLLSKVFVDKGKVAGVELDDKTFKERIYDQYMQAYKKGVFNFIKEDYDALSQQMIPRKYFSGGIKDGAMRTKQTKDYVQIAGSVMKPYKMSLNIKPQKDGEDISVDNAMLGFGPFWIGGARKVLDSLDDYSVKQIIKSIKIIQGYQQKTYDDVNRLKKILEYKDVEARRIAKKVWMEIDGDNWELNLLINDLSSKDVEKRRSAIVNISKHDSINHLFVNEEKFDGILDLLINNLISFELVDADGLSKDSAKPEDNMAEEVFESHVVEFYSNHSFPYLRRVVEESSVLDIIVSVGALATSRLEGLLKVNVEELVVDHPYLAYTDGSGVVHSRLKVNKYAIERAIQNIKSVEKSNDASFKLVEAAYIGLDSYIEDNLYKFDDLNFRGIDGRTALMQASLNGHMKIVEMLLNEGVLIDMKDNYGNTALMLAAQRGHFDIVKLLLSIGANVGIENDDDKTAEVIAEEGYMEIAQVLAERRVDIFLNSKGEKVVKETGFKSELVGPGPGGYLEKTTEEVFGFLDESRKIRMQKTQRTMARERQDRNVLKVNASIDKYKRFNAESESMKEAGELFNRGNYKKAGEIYYNLIAERSVDIEEGILGRLEIDSDDIFGTIYVKNGTVFHDLGIVYLELKKFDDAVNVLMRAMNLRWEQKKKIISEIDSKDTDLEIYHYVLAVAFFRLYGQSGNKEHLKGAVTNCKKSLEFDPEYADVYRLLSKIYPEDRKTFVKKSKSFPKKNYSKYEARSGIKYKDFAMLSEVGGINMNTINVDHQGSGVNIQFDPINMQGIIDMGIDGFVPVIINITPIQSIMPLLGFAPRKEDEEIALAK